MDARAHSNHIGSSSNQGVNLPPPAPQSAADDDSSKRMKRLLMNREYAQRCRQKKQEYMQELLGTVTALEAKIRLLSPEVSFYRAQMEEQEKENIAIRQKLAQEEQQASIDEAKILSLKMEKERLTWKQQMIKQQQEEEK